MIAAGSNLAWECPDWLEGFSCRSIMLVRRAPDDQMAITFQLRAAAEISKRSRFSIIEENVSSQAPLV